MADSEASKSTGLLARVRRMLPARRRERKPQIEPNEREIASWIVKHVAQTLAIDPRDVDPTVPFAEYGFDSRTAVGLSGELEGRLGLELAPTLVWDHPTIESMAVFLATECAAKAANRDR